MSKWTPGPWVSRLSEDQCDIFVESSDSISKNCGGRLIFQIYRLDATDSANHRLLIEAPAMAELLAECAERIDGKWPLDLANRVASLLERINK